MNDTAYEDTARVRPTSRIDDALGKQTAMLLELDEAIGGAVQAFASVCESTNPHAEVLREVTDRGDRNADSAVFDRLAEHNRRIGDMTATMRDLIQRSQA